MSRSDKRNTNTAVHEVLRVCLLLVEDKLFEPTGQLSGDQQQRTRSTRPASDSPLLMADEPVSSVDEHQSRRVLDAITEAHATMILAMHDSALAITYADRVIGLDDGCITLDQSTDGIRSSDLDALYGG